MNRWQWLILSACLVASTALAGFNDFCFNSFSITGGGQCREQIPILTLSPTSYAFGTMSTGVTRYARFTVTNSGKGVLTNISTSKPSAPYRVYSSATCKASTLTGGQYCAFGVEYKPTAAVLSRYSTLVSSNQFASPTVAMVSGTGKAAASYLLSEDFTAGTAPSGWTAASTYLTYNYTPAIVGDYSMAMNTQGNSNSLSATTGAFTASSDVYAAARFRYATAGIVGTGTVLAIRDTGNAVLCSIAIDASENLDGIVTGGTDVANFYPTLAVDTTIFVRVRYQKGTGSNAVCTFWTSSDGTNWTAEGSGTNGTGSNDATHLYFASSSTNENQIIWDSIRVSTSEINY